MISVQSVAPVRNVRVCRAANIARKLCIYWPIGQSVHCPYIYINSHRTVPCMDGNVVCAPSRARWWWFKIALGASHAKHSSSSSSHTEQNGTYEFVGWQLSSAAAGRHTQIATGLLYLRLRLPFVCDAYAYMVCVCVLIASSGCLAPHENNHLILVVAAEQYNSFHSSQRDRSGPLPTWSHTHICSTVHNTHTHHTYNRRKRNDGTLASSFSIHDQVVVVVVVDATFVAIQ